MVSGNNGASAFTFRKDIQTFATSPLNPPPMSSLKAFVEDALNDSPFEFSALNSLAVLTGTLTFAASLSLSTLIQHKLLKISTSTPPPIPSILGFGTVAAAALVSHAASLKAYECTMFSNAASLPYHHHHSARHFQSALADIGERWSWTLPSVDLNVFHDDKRKRRENVSHVLRVCVVGILAYKGLGGRMWSVSPSSITNLGSFARTTFSLPATTQYATKTERQAIERLGRVFGCHTCGSRELLSGAGTEGVKFIADHMPPQAVVKQMNRRWHRRILGIKVQQRFYPQCVSCSNKQGGILSRATRELRSSSSSFLTGTKGKINLSTSGGGSNAHFHGTRIRLEHLAGGIVAAATVFGADNSDIMRNGGGNRKRFLGWQNTLEEVVTQTCVFVSDFFNEEKK